MSKHVCTIHFSRPFSEGRLVENFCRAAEEVGGSSFFLKGKAPLDLDLANLKHLMSQFSPYEYVGEVRWRIETRKKNLMGKLTYPIQSTIALPGTLEFEFAWLTPETKTFFDSLDELLRFLQRMVVAVDADSLIVEPKKLPPDIHDVRYKRFKASENGKDLSSVDWIIGFRKSDFSSWLSAAEPFCVSNIDTGDVMIFAFSENPLDYSNSEDRGVLENLEDALGI